jgi:hypothetical protein
VYDLAPIRDTGLNNALKLTDQEVARLSPLRLPAIHKRLDIAYGNSRTAGAGLTTRCSFMKRAWTRARRADLSRSRAQTISASLASCGVLTARLSISRWNSSDSRLARGRLHRCCVDPDLIVHDPDWI